MQLLSCLICSCLSSDLHSLSLSVNRSLESKDGREWLNNNYRQ